MKREPIRQTIFLGCVLLGALLARLPHLNDSLWFDEIVRTSVGLRGESLRWVMFHDVHPPLYALVMWGWIQLFGDSEIAVRLPPLLFGLGSIAITFALAKRWFGHRIALLAASLLALSPPHVWYSHENKTNMLLLFLTVGLVWALDRAWKSNRRQHWLTFILASVLALWTNAFAVFVVVAALLWLWAQGIQTRRRDRLRWAVAASAVLACSYLPLVWSALSQLDSLRRSYLRPFTLAEAYKLLLIYLSHGNTLRTISPYAPFAALFRQPWPWFLMEGFFAVLLVNGLGRVVRRSVERGDSDRAVLDRLEARLLLSYFLVPPLCLWVASCLYPQIYIERSMLILLPPFVMLLAAGVLGLPRRRWRAAAMAALLGLNAWALLNLVVVKADEWTVYKPKNDWRSAARFFASEMHDDGTPLLIFATAPASVLVYYDHRIIEAPDTGGIRQGTRALIYYVSGRDKATLVNRLRGAHTDTFYLIEDRYWNAGFKTLLENVAGDPEFQRIVAPSFKGLTVFKFKWGGYAE